MPYLDTKYCGNFMKSTVRLQKHKNLFHVCWSLLRRAETGTAGRATPRKFYLTNGPARILQWKNKYAINLQCLNKSARKLQCTNKSARTLQCKNKSARNFEVEFRNKKHTPIPMSRNFELNSLTESLQKIKPQ